MNQQVKEQWIAALESGEFEQGKSKLHSVDNKYCCLGVLCELAVRAKVIAPPRANENIDDRYVYGREEAGSSLPYEVIVWAGFPEDSDGLPEVAKPASLADDPRFKHSNVIALHTLNDTVEMPFSEIAAAIRESL